MLFNFPKSTAYHEAGHAIAWTALTGHTPYAIHRGIFAVNTMPSSNPYMPMPDGLLGRDILYTLAGAAAQAKFQGKSFARVWQGHGCWGDQEHLDCWGVQVTDELVKATHAILKPRWKLVDGLAKALLDNDGSMYRAELQEWCSQVQPHTDHDELLARLNKKMTSRKHDWFVRVQDDWNGWSSSPDHLTFFADDEEDLRDYLLGFVRHELDREDHGDEEIASFLEDIGVKVDLDDPCFEDIYEEQAPAIIDYFFNNDPQYTIVEKSPALKWLQPETAAAA